MILQRAGGMRGVDTPVFADAVARGRTVANPHIQLCCYRHTICGRGGLYANFPPSACYVAGVVIGCPRLRPSLHPTRSSRLSLNWTASSLRRSFARTSCLCPRNLRYLRTCESDFAAFSRRRLSTTRWPRTTACVTAYEATALLATIPGPTPRDSQVIPNARPRRGFKWKPPWIRGR